MVTGRDAVVLFLCGCSGKVLWYRNLKADKEADYNPEWFICGSPLVLADRVILNTKSAGIAVDKMTGKTL